MKKFWMCLVACGLMLLAPQPGWPDAASDLSVAFSALTKDLTLVGGWVNDQLEKSTALAAGETVIRPGAVKSFPGFEIGLTSGITSGFDTNSPLSGLDTYGISPDFLQLPPFFFNPAAMLHVKIGLFSLPGIGKIDAGVGFSNYELQLVNDLYGKFGQWHLEARIQPDLPLPLDFSLTLGAGNAKGTYTVSKNHQEEILGIEYSGSRYTQTLSTRVFMSSDWNVNAYYARLIASKTLLFLTPYVGAGLQVASGEVNTLVGAEGTITLDPELAGPNASQTVLLQNAIHDKPRAFDWVAMAGLQISFFPFMNLNLGAELGDQVFGASAGLVLSFL